MINVPPPTKLERVYRAVLEGYGTAGAIAPRVGMAPQNVSLCLRLLVDRGRIVWTGTGVRRVGKGRGPKHYVTET